MFSAAPQACLLASAPRGWNNRPLQGPGKAAPVPGNSFICCRMGRERTAPQGGRCQRSGRARDAASIVKHGLLADGLALLSETGTQACSKRVYGACRAGRLHPEPRHGASAVSGDRDGARAAGSDDHRFHALGRQKISGPRRIIGAWEKDHRVLADLEHVSPGQAVGIAWRLLLIAPLWSIGRRSGGTRGKLDASRIASP